MPQSHTGPYGIGDLEEWNTDTSVDPPTMVRGMMIKTSAGWSYWDGSVTGGSSSSSTSAIQGDAGLLRTSSSIFSVTPGTNATNLGKAEDSQHTSGDVGVMLLAVRNEDGTDFSGTDKDYIPIAVDAKGHIFIRSGDENLSVTQSDASLLRISAFNTSANPLYIQPPAVGYLQTNLNPITSGGVDTYLSISVSAGANIKGSAGQLYGYYAWNNDTHVNYIKLYNVSGAVNLGTDSPKMYITMPASAAGHVEYPHGIPFSNGMGIAATSGVPIDNTAAPATSSVGITLLYK